jgi:hypothetical protein
MQIYKEKIIKFSNPIPLSHKNKLCKFVTSKVLKISIISNISYDEGFNLPLTQEWKQIAIDPYNFLNDHNFRQLLFNIEDNNIIGLYYKDGIYCWSIEEVNELLKLINNYIFINC